VLRGVLEEKRTINEEKQGGWSVSGQQAGREMILKRQKRTQSIAKEEK